MPLTNSSKCSEFPTNVLQLHFRIFLWSCNGTWEWEKRNRERILEVGLCRYPGSLNALIQNVPERCSRGGPLWAGSGKWNVRFRCRAGGLSGWARENVFMVQANKSCWPEPRSCFRSGTAIRIGWMACVISNQINGTRMRHPWDAFDSNRVAAGRP